MGTTPSRRGCARPSGQPNAWWQPNAWSRPLGLSDGRHWLGSRNRPFQRRSLAAVRHIAAPQVAFRHRTNARSRSGCASLAARRAPGPIFSPGAIWLCCPLRRTLRMLSQVLFCLFSPIKPAGSAPRRQQPPRRPGGPVHWPPPAALLRQGGSVTHRERCARLSSWGLLDP